MDSPLRERARSRDISWGDEISGVRMARTGAVFCGLGALFGLLSAALPDTVVHDQNLLVLVAVLTAALGMALFAAQDRIPVRAFHAVVVAGTALAGVAVYAWGTGSAYVPLPFLWVTLFAFYFFPLRAALVHMALVAVAYAIVLSAEDHSGTRVDGWVATVGTLLVAGVFVALLRDRLVRHHPEPQPGVESRSAHRSCSTAAASQDTFDTELERARRSHAPLSLVVGDLDGLARVNAELGRAAGDEALRHVAGGIPRGQAELRLGRPGGGRGVRPARSRLRRARRLHDRRAGADGHRRPVPVTSPSASAWPPSPATGAPPRRSCGPPTRRCRPPRRWDATGR